MKTSSDEEFLLNKQFKTEVSEKGRVCTACEKFKPWSDFKGHARSKTGHSSKCKQCYKEERKTKGRRKERYSRKKRMAQLKKEQPFKFKAMHLRSSLMQRALKEGSDRSNIPTRSELQVWLEKEPLICYYTSVPLSIKTLHVDHKVPPTRGGQHVISNLCLTDPKVNSSKGKLTDTEFEELLALVSGWEDKGSYLMTRLRMGWRAS